MFSFPGFTIDAHVTVRFLDPVPSAPTVLGIISIRGSTMAILKNTITFSAPVAVGVTRVATIILTPAGGSPEPSITLDVTDPTATFASNDGDSANVTAIDSNANGPSLVSQAFVAVTTVGGGGVPAAPVITGITSVLA
jgi:hypothetical protein